MKVQDFLDISEFINYMVLDEEDICLSSVIDKYNAMKLCGLKELLKVDYKFITSKNNVGVVCMLYVDDTKKV